MICAEELFPEYERERGRRHAIAADAEDLDALKPDLVVVEGAARRGSELASERFSVLTD